MKKSEFARLLRNIISEEIRKELPGAISDALSNTKTIKEGITNAVEDSTGEETINLKQSLKEMFSGTNVISNKPPETTKKFTNNPVLNEVLNSTRPFSQSERTGASMGIAAMMASANAGNMPSPSTHISFPTVSPTQILRDDHIPLETLPEGVSVMDVKQHAPPVIAKALTRDYSQMMKLIDKKREKKI